LSPKLDHVFAEGTSCTEPRTCLNCGKSFAAGGSHTAVVDAAVAATCTQSGLTEGSHCSTCNTVLVAQSVIPATGHNYGDWVITVQPTETSYGVKVRTCANCGDEQAETIEKLVSSGGGEAEVTDLPPLDEGKTYDLEVSIEATDDMYNVSGTNCGYKVALYITEDGERIGEYDQNKTVTLSLIVPDKIDVETFSLYKVEGDTLRLIDPSEYTVNGRIVTLKTELAAEIVFHNDEAASSDEGGVPWWLWLILALVLLLLIAIVAFVVIRNNKDDDEETAGAGAGASGSGAGGAGSSAGGTVEPYDDSATKAQLAKHEREIKELQEMDRFSDDDGFYDDADQ
jgi:hypothetical protein